jgi:hypothetical protein
MWLQPVIHWLEEMMRDLHGRSHYRPGEDRTPPSDGRKRKPQAAGLHFDGRIVAGAPESRPPDSSWWVGSRSSAAQISGVWGQIVASLLAACEKSLIGSTVQLSCFVLELRVER